MVVIINADVQLHYIYYQYWLIQITLLLTVGLDPQDMAEKF